MVTLSEIRSSFLHYFNQLEGGKSHKILPSSSLIPRNDPTLMFTNAGMVQFKDIFTGREQSPSPRVVTSQKCVRAGGKHNDLENVGYTARHHTFFEMLGNFSFGDYFKEDAIEMAWNFITREMEIPAEKLWITVFAEDEEAASLWRKIAGLKDERILRIPTADNFWSMGEFGPCGPCSEIFYDHGPHIPGGLPGTPDQEGDRFVEIWNLVFMQFDQQLDEKGNIRRINLPKPSIDTGMGLERVAAVLQGVHNNYDMDLFKKLIHTSSDLLNMKAEGASLPSHRVIADHLRACSFLIADGVTPSNEGRGYVLRRIMRRAMRHAHQLGSRSPVLWKMVPVLVDLMGTSYPELERAAPLISETILLEENRFQDTLGRGLGLLSEEVGKISVQRILPGSIAFKLYDTYGFPVDLTQDILKVQNIQVDMAEFESVMARRKAEARAAWSGSGDAMVDQVWFNLRDRLGETEFLGYTDPQAVGSVLALINDKGEELEKAQEGEKVQIIVNQTPFYGESGGQAGDAGVIVTDHGSQLKVEDTLKKAGSLIVHQCRVEAGTVAVGDVVTLKIDEKRRQRLRTNHSATHLLHGILREKLGDHVVQKGSLVSAHRLRFDFSHQRPLPSELLLEIESLLNQWIRANFPVTTVLKTPESALAGGAIGLFGEKYSQEVRVVSMGDEDFHASTELCGGTHVSRTGEIGYFKITSESGVAAGIRRIEALTGQDAEKFMNDLVKKAQEAASILKAPLGELGDKIHTLLKDKKKLEEQLIQARSPGAGGVQASVKTINQIDLYWDELKDVTPKDLRRIMDTYKPNLKKPSVVVITSQEEDKVSLVMGVTPDLTHKISAANLVQSATQILGGKGGGGRADFAQGGGPDQTKLKEMIHHIEEALSRI
jgi:alanyl-tRNA synthetase